MAPFLIDLDSANGSTVNGDEIPKSRYFELRSGDTCQFGASVREYVFLDETAAPKIEKGEMRLGVIAEIMGHTSMVWRHWGCTTDRVLKNVIEAIGDAPELDGFETLYPLDQKNVMAAFKQGHLREEDVTPILREQQEVREARRAANEEDGKSWERKPRRSRKKKDELVDEDTRQSTDDDEDALVNIDGLDDMPAKRKRKPTQHYRPSPRKKRGRVVMQEDTESDMDSIEDESDVTEDSASDDFEGSDEDEDE
ncbi:hypothetical protein MVES1_004009 [Malassezia vespertilionis]|uniref:uncharacterized protein n=1 Tax=Malassezia vespertilionis TaxID=2020962 RepID=UPI0024B1871C|nr:uncharacterized protein MVES1_004009 [Malassezia vespertilionis]WFD08632.1 hypothetical protein MVES1_004009 [Malassezia vespertilionis]